MEPRAETLVEALDGGVGGGGGDWEFGPMLVCESIYGLFLLFPLLFPLLPLLPLLPPLRLLPLPKPQSGPILYLHLAQSRPNLRCISNSKNGASNGEDRGI